MEKAFDWLDAPIARVTGKDVPILMPPILKTALPQVDDIVATAIASCEGFRGVVMAITPMPALSPTMESGTLSKWTIAVGDPVRSGDVIAEIETDKATMGEAVDDGVLASILVADGSDGVAVGTVIARLAEDGEAVGGCATTGTSITSASILGTSIRPCRVSAASQTDGVADPVPAVAAPVKQVLWLQSRPRRHLPHLLMAVNLARRIAADRGIDLARLSGGPHGRCARCRRAGCVSPRDGRRSRKASASAPVAGASSLEPNW